VARLVGQALSDRLGQQFVIENKGGAGGNIAADAVVHALPDGYTLLVVGLSNAVNASLYEKLSFDFLQDITPVAAIVRVPRVMVVNPSLPVQSVPEFITYAKAAARPINMATAGVGAPQHVYGELLKMKRFQRPYLALILVIVPSALSLLREAFALLKFSDAVFGNAATIGRDRAG
jgi:tripartite-type tricarboxylate transporter receptor subunit TctC